MHELSNPTPSFLAVGGNLQPGGGMHPPNPSLERVWGDLGTLSQRMDEHGKDMGI
jgi:hypothetical protein